MASPLAAGLTPIVGVSDGMRRSQGCRVVPLSAVGRRGAGATFARRCVVSYRPQWPAGFWRVLRSAWCPATAADRSQRAGHACAVWNGARRSRWCRLACSWGGVPGFGLWWIRALAVPHTSHEGAAEGTEDLVHKCCVRCLGFRLSTDGGQQLSAHRQRPDLMHRKKGAQVSRSGGLRRSLVLGDGLQLLSAVQVEPPGRRPVPGVQPGGTLEHLSATECTYLPIYLPTLTGGINVGRT